MSEAAQQALILVAALLIVVGSPGYYWYGRGPSYRAPGYAPATLFVLVIIVLAVWYVLPHAAFSRGTL